MSTFVTILLLASLLAFAAASVRGAITFLTTSAAGTGAHANTVRTRHQRIFLRSLAMLVFAAALFYLFKS